MTFEEECKKMAEDISAIRSDAKAKVKEFFFSRMKKLFELHPVIQQISWIQYTPDNGDDCVFSAYHKDASVNELSEGDNDFEFIGEKPQDYDEMLEYAAKDVNSFLGSFSENDMYDLFGDNARVIITKDGIKTEDYEYCY